MFVRLQAAETEQLRLRESQLLRDTLGASAMRSARTRSLSPPSPVRVCGLAVIRGHGSCVSLCVCRSLQAVPYSERVAQERALLASVAESLQALQRERAALEAEVSFVCVSQSPLCLLYLSLPETCVWCVARCNAHRKPRAVLPRACRTRRCEPSQSLSRGLIVFVFVGEVTFYNSKWLV